jgi:hypothetical protein
MILEDKNHFNEGGLVRSNLTLIPKNRGGNKSIRSLERMNGSECLIPLCRNQWRRWRGVISPLSMLPGS